MTQCPACGAAAKPTAAECACGESLAAWRNVAWSGAALRDRGLTLAAAGDFLGAAVALLEAALTNPLDTASLVDAARAMVRLGRVEDAVRWLETVKSAPGAAALLALASKKPEEAAVEPPQPPATGLPLLALPPITRHSGGGFFGKRSDKPIPAMWDRVIRMEAEGERDWRPRGLALEELVRGDDRSVYHYALGLGEYQAGNRPGAAEAFRTCLGSDPPVLNPAIYLVHVHGDDPTAVNKVWAELAQRYPAKELERCRTALEQRPARSDANASDITPT